MSSDSDIIERSMRTPSVFAELFHRHAASVHRYAARRAGNDAADDVTSETFLIAFERRDRFDLSAADARPWLFGVATNLLHRRRVAEARVFGLLERLPAETAVDDPSFTIDERADAARAVRAMAHAIRKLSTGDRDCLLLYAWADLSYEQIAVALTIPVGTVRSRLNRARRTVRTISDPSKEGKHERVDVSPDLA